MNGPGGEANASRTLLILPAPARGYVSEAACRRLGLRSRRVGSAPSPSSRPASRRAVLRARVSPRGSACSRRASPQRQTRPEARAHARAAFQAVRLVQKLLPTLCVETVDNSGICEPQALGTQAATPGATLSRPGAVRHPSNGGNAQLNGGRATEIRAKSANLLATRRRSTVTGTRRWYEAKALLFPRSLPAPLSKDGSVPANCVLSFRKSLTSPERKRV